ncbi:MAG: thioredoxin family protein [Methylovirgula sp.]
MSLKGSILSLAIASALALASGLILARCVTPAMASEQVLAFDQAVFEAAQKAQKPILVHITAPWCPDCRAQNAILARLFTDPKFKDLVTFNIDFDSQKAIVRRFGATVQSTLIVFKGSKEEGRSTGETKANQIEALLDKVV